MMENKTAEAMDKINTITRKEKIERYIKIGIVCLCICRLSVFYSNVIIDQFNLGGILKLNKMNLFEDLQQKTPLDGANYITIKQQTNGLRHNSE